MIKDENLSQYFHGLVQAAIKNQKIEAQETTKQYLSSVLESFLYAERLMNEPLAEAYLKALGAGNEAQGFMMKQLGDFSLFISGFFPESLKNKIIDIDYYVMMGCTSYNTLADVNRAHRNAALEALFSELAAKFTAFMDVYSEISERTRITSQTDILRVYEKWIKTRSRHAEKLLRELGIEPMSLNETLH